MRVPSNCERLAARACASLWLLWLLSLLLPLPLSLLLMMMMVMVAMSPLLLHLTMLV
jgi:hypothetical protein